MSKRGLAVFGLAVAIGLAGCATEDYKGMYEEQQKLNLDLAAQNDEVKQQRAEQASKAEEYAKQLKQSDMEAQKLRIANEEAAKEREAVRPQAAGAEAAKPEAGATSSMDAKAMRDLVDQLKAELGKGASEVGVTKDGNIEITLASDVTFSSGSAELTESGKKSLKTLAPLLKGKFAPYQIRVEGHTDSTPLVRTKEKYKDNFGLGSARSLSVVRYMESDMSVEPTRLMSASRGEHDPIANDKTEAGKKKNRRVDIVVVIPHDAAISMAK
jgi:chemotaxis protein MotB